MAVPELPDIPSISARGQQSDSDWSAVARIYNAAAVELGVEKFLTPAEIEGWLANDDDVDQDNDYLFVAVGDETVGYVMAFTYEEYSGRRLYRHNGRVDPAWQRRGIGTAMLEWAIEHNRERAATTGRGILQTNVWNDDPVLTTMLEARGYVAGQHDAELVRPHLDAIPDRRLPDALELRPVEPSHLRKIYEADVEAFKDHWGSAPQGEGSWKAFLEFAHRDESLWKVAWDGDRVAGQVRGYVSLAENEHYGRGRGWAEFISTARDWRRRGVAGALICETLREFRARGLDQAALGVHVENRTGAFSLYEGLGFEIAAIITEFERPLEPAASAPV